VHISHDDKVFVPLRKLFHPIVVVLHLHHLLASIAVAMLMGIQFLHNHHRYEEEKRGRETTMV
jgi:hypothetical protein